MNLHESHAASFRRLAILLLSWVFVVTQTSLAAQVMLGPDAPAPLPEVTDFSGSLFRLLGAFVLVVSLFLGGIWMFRRWQRSARNPHQGPRLRVLDVQSLGARQAVYVVAYERQRWLIGSSTAGLNLLSQLPDGVEEGTAGAPSAPASFAVALQDLLSRRSA